MGIAFAPEIPLAIPAPNIANGSVSNTEFQRLDGVGSALAGISDTATLTNKTIAAGSNTITGLTAGTFSNQSANVHLAGPASGGSAAPTFRALVVADLPTAIDAANIANASVSNAEFQRLDGVGSALAGISDTATLTNKTINAANNTLTGVALLSGAAFTGTVSVTNSSGSASATVAATAGTASGFLRVYGPSFSVGSLANKMAFGPDGTSDGIVIFGNANVTSGSTGNVSIRGGGYDTAAERITVSDSGVILRGNNVWVLRADGGIGFAVTNNVDTNLQLSVTASGAGTKQAFIAPSTNTDLVLGMNDTEKIRLALTLVTVSQPFRFPRHTVGTLPTAGTNGRVVYCTNGRMNGEGTGAGQGGLAWDNGSNWQLAQRVDTQGSGVAA